MRILKTLSLANRSHTGYGDPSAVSGDFLGGLPSGLPLLLLEGVPLNANDLTELKATTGLRYLYVGGTGLSSTDVDGLLDGLPRRCRCWRWTATTWTV